MSSALAFSEFVFVCTELIYRLSNIECVQYFWINDVPLTNYVSYYSIIHNSCNEYNDAKK